MSNRRKPESMRKNAVQGAITRWCPSCKRKAALLSDSHCRYCGYFWRGKHSEKMQMYKAELVGNFGTVTHWKYGLNRRGEGVIDRALAAKDGEE